MTAIAKAVLEAACQDDNRVAPSLGIDIRCSTEAGDTLGGLLNATLGRVAEPMIALAAHERGNRGNGSYVQASNGRSQIDGCP
jgi:hypothetical protein